DAMAPANPQTREARDAQRITARSAACAARDRPNTSPHQRHSRHDGAGDWRYRRCVDRSVESVAAAPSPPGPGARGRVVSRAGVDGPANPLGVVTRSPRLAAAVEELHWYGPLHEQRGDADQGCGAGFAAVG